MSILEQKSKRTQLLFVFLISQIILVSYVLPLITAVLILTEESPIGDVFGKSLMMMGFVIYICLTLNPGSQTWITSEIDKAGRTRGYVFADLSHCSVAATLFHG